MSEMMSDLQWMRFRHWIDEEIARLDTLQGDYYEGQYVAFLKVKGRGFLTEQERIEGERTRWEMFG